MRPSAVSYQRPWFWPGTVIAVAGAAAAAIAITVAVRGGTPSGVDIAVRDLAIAHESEPGHRLAAGLTLLGSGPLLYPVLLFLCLMMVAGRRSMTELLPVPTLAAGQVLELVLFATLHRPAPSGDPATSLITTYSSGHTSAAVLGWGLIAWQAGRLRGPRIASRGSSYRLWTLALSLGLVVGATRIYLGLHWLTDGLAGIVFGSALLAAVLLGATHLDTRPPATSQRSPALSPAVPRGDGAVTRLGHWLRTSSWAWSLPAAAALVPIVPIPLAPPSRRLIDMLVYHGAGDIAGAGENVYAYQTVFAMPFTYPPFAALVLEPMARMPLGLAQTLWTAATLVAVVALAATALRPVADRIGMPLTVAALLLTSPVRSHFRFGQVGVFLVLLVTLDLLRRGRARRDDRAAGWGLGLATAIKLTPAVFLPWLALTRQWRRLAATLLWCGGATLLGLVLLWPSSGDYLLRAARDTSRFGANDIPGNQSVRGMLLRAMPDPTAERAWLVAVVVLMVVGTYQAWRCEKDGNRLAAVGVLAALSVAVSPISWMHHLVWLALPIAALATAGRFRLVAAWFLVLTVSFHQFGRLLESALPSLPFLSRLVTDVPGLTAVAAVLLLPRLVRAPPMLPTGLTPRTRARPPRGLASARPSAPV